MSIAHTLRRICELQPHYSSNNSAQMRERGTLIRHTLVADLAQWMPELRVAAGHFGVDLGVRGSDGIGRKTEAAWVRIYSKAMSPAPTSGYYVVIHFAADGSATFVTVGCGSTVWADGDLVSVPLAELAERTRWGRAAIERKFGTIAPFVDEIDLKAKAELPRTFERATVVAKRIAVREIEDEVVHSLVVRAVAMLSAIYDAQLAGGETYASRLHATQVEALVNPARPLRGQGYGLTAAERRAVERRAMEVAEAWLLSEGFDVQDRSAKFPFDFEASRDGLSFKIEVKGTTAEMADSILMTKNEVDLHRNERGSTGLIRVSAIRLVRKLDNPPEARDGVVTADLSWDISSWEIEPTVFRVFRRP